MINSRSGFLKFEKRFSLKPNSKESDFDAPIGNGWDDAEGNRWRIINFEGRMWKGNEFSISAIFKNGAIDSVELMQISGRLGEGWDDFKDESEVKRKKVHDAILDEALGEERIFKWGSVSSDYSRQVGCATLKVLYGERPEPEPEPEAPVVDNYQGNQSFRSNGP